MSQYMVQCLSHSPLMGKFDPPQAILEEVNREIAMARHRIRLFDPELVVLFAPDHYNGFFYDLMPQFCLGTEAFAIGDFGTARGRLRVPAEIAIACAVAVVESGIDLAISHRMRVDHGFAQPLMHLSGDLDRFEVIPIFINSVAPPLPSFARARALGEAVGRFLRSLNRRVLLIGSGGLSHEPPVPDLHTTSPLTLDRLKGGGRHLPPDEREAREKRVMEAARDLCSGTGKVRPLAPEWDRAFLDCIEFDRLADTDDLENDSVTIAGGKSAHECKTWIAALGGLAALGPYQVQRSFYRPIPQWIAGFAMLTASVGQA